MEFKVFSCGIRKRWLLRRYSNRMEFKDRYSSVTETLHSVDIATEWNLKDFSSHITKRKNRVDIATEWNLKHDRFHIINVHISRYSNRMEFKDSLLHVLKQKVNSRYSNRMEFKESGRSGKGTSLEVDIATEWNLKYRKSY